MQVRTWCHDNRQSNIQYNDSQHNSKKYGTQYNDIQNIDIDHNGQ